MSTVSKRAGFNRAEPGTSGNSTVLLDCYGLVCPMPVRKTAQAMDELQPGQILHVIATDEWFGPDLEAWLRHHPHDLLALEQVEREIHAYVRRGASHLMQS